MRSIHRVRLFLCSRLVTFLMQPCEECNLSVNAETMVDLFHKKAKKAEIHMELRIRITVNGQISLERRSTQLHQPVSIFV